MILARLQLRNVAPSQVLRIARDGYSLHRAVWSLFADDPDRRRDFLYRLDQTREGAVIFTLSEREPVDTENLWHIEAKPFKPVLEPGDRLRFRVRVNPTVKREGKRHDVVMDRKKSLLGEKVARKDWPSDGVLVQEEGIAWLKKRAQTNGFEPEEATTRADSYFVHEFRRRSDQRVRLATCDLTGTLVVGEPDRFLAMVGNGLGPAKGFGCGLMLLARTTSIGE